MIAGLLNIAEKIRDDEQMNWDDRVLLAALSHIAHQQLAKRIERTAEQRAKHKATKEANDTTVANRLAKVKEILYDDHTPPFDPPYVNNLPAGMKR